MARPKGSLNKITVELRGMIEKALIAAGGVDYLTRQATENPGAFLALLGKTLPKDINLAATGSLYLSIYRSKCLIPPTNTSVPASQ
jgi:hypothetical protein